jgi:lysozyme family protein
MANLADLKSKNIVRWNNAKIISQSFDPVAKQLSISKSSYQSVSDKTGVPWDVIAVIHERESSQSWLANLAQGDPWDKVSVHVPKGRGPFSSWADAAVDALTNCAPFAAKWSDWSIGGTLTLLEMYNGLGYAGRGLPSPYIWSGTDQYVSGKYVADHDFRPEVIDHQLGCAGLLMAIRKIDQTAVAPPEQPSFLQVLINFIMSIFKRS